MCRRVVGAARICEAVEKFTRSDGDVWRLCVRDLLSSEVEARSHSIPVSFSSPALAASHPGFLRRRSDNCRFIGLLAGILVFRSIGRVDD